MFSLAAAALRRRRCGGGSTVHMASVAATACRCTDISMSTTWRVQWSSPIGVFFRIWLIHSRPQFTMAVGVQCTGLVWGRLRADAQILACPLIGSSMEQNWEVCLKNWLSHSRPQYTFYRKYASILLICLSGANQPFESLHISFLMIPCHALVLLTSSSRGVELSNNCLLLFCNWLISKWHLCFTQ